MTPRGRRTHSIKGPSLFTLMGQIIGATNSKGEHPVERLLTPNDLWATVYQHLGIDHTHHLMNLQGLPMQILPFGKPIEELAPMSA